MAVDQKPTTGTMGIGAGVRVGVGVDGGVGDIWVGVALGSAVELGITMDSRAAVAGLLGSILEVGAGSAPAMTMAATSSPRMDRRIIRLTRTAAA